MSRASAGRAWELVNPALQTRNGCVKRTVRNADWILIAGAGGDEPASASNAPSDKSTRVPGSGTGLATCAACDRSFIGAPLAREGSKINVPLVAYGQARPAGAAAAEARDQRTARIHARRPS